MALARCHGSLIWKTPASRGLTLPRYTEPSTSNCRKRLSHQAIFTMIGASANSARTRASTSRESGTGKNSSETITIPVTATAMARGYRGKAAPAAAEPRRRSGRATLTRRSARSM